MKKKIKTLAKAGVLAVLLISMLIGLNSLFVEKHYTAHMKQILQAPNNTYDVILAGTSHMQFAIQPAQLFGEQGISSCNISTPAQSIPSTYYLLKEMIDRHDPELVVVDLFYLFLSDHVYGTPWLHQAIDFLPLSQNKIDAVKSLIWENHAEYYFPLFFYHDRWQNLTQDDYVLYSKSNETFELLDGLTVFDTPFTPIPKDQTAEIPATPLYYLEQIVALCKETDTELLLTVIPYRADVDNHETSAVYQQQIYNTVEQLALEWGVDYINGLDYLEEMEFDFTTDLVEFSHVNVSGSTKVTRFYGNYICENYDVPDCSEDPDYADWYEDYNEYLRVIQEYLK